MPGDVHARSVWLESISHGECLRTALDAPALCAQRARMGLPSLVGSVNAAAC